MGQGGLVKRYPHVPGVDFAGTGPSIDIASCSRWATR